MGSRYTIAAKTVTYKPDDTLQLLQRALKEICHMANTMDVNENRWLLKKNRYRLLFLVDLK